MRAVRFERFGEPGEVLALVELEPPALAAGQARVRVSLRPINPADLLTIRGRYGSLPQLPATPGREGTGTVLAVEGGSDELKPGDRVVILDETGTWQEEITIDARRLVVVPAALGEEAAAQAFLNPLSAWAMLEELRIPEGGWLLQSAAASALGKLVGQMARERGLRTLNIVRRADQATALQTLGADEVVVWPDDDKPLSDRVRQAAGGDVRYALDAVGGRLGGEMINCLGSGGVMLVHGSLAHPETMPVSSGRFLTRSLILRGFWLNEWLSRTPLELQRNAVTSILADMAAGALRAPDVEATYDLAAVHEAVAHAERSREGKILLSG
jgi:NADPH:quinone reductase-like Zn-dependent oxidoreductase